MSVVKEKQSIEEIEEKVIIYGAHLVAFECMHWMKRMGKEVIGFAVTDLADNPENIEGIPVKRIDDYKGNQCYISVIIAMPEKYHQAVEKKLNELGYKNVYKVTLEEMSVIKGIWLIDQGEMKDERYVLKKSENDPTWLDLIDNKSGEILCKFPTLFYLDKKEIDKRIKKYNFALEIKHVLGNIQDVTSHVNADLISQAFDTDIKNILRVYMAFSANDIIKVENKKYDEWIFPLQVGSKYAEMKYGNIFDDEGNNISDKNSLFAEMTGAYWIWKNAPKTQYKGLCHYRRHFILNTNIIRQLIDAGIDVILTTPRFVPGGIRGMFLAETPVKSSVMENMLQAVKDVSPLEKEKFEQYLDTEFYYPNNMVIAKSEIYNEYCVWIFSILFRMLEIDIEKKYECINDRHIAYAAELLTSYFFVKQKETYEIVFTDYKFSY